MNLEPLLAAVPGPDPRGEDLWRRDVKDRFDEARKEVVSFAAKSSALARPKVETPGKWGLIIREAQEILAEKAKDLYVAVRLAEALTKEHGFAGLADGMALIRRLVDEAWDRLYPDIEDGDVEVRGTPINWLGDNERANNFPLVIRCVPMVGDFAWIDFNPSALTSAPVVDKAVEERRKQAVLAAGAAGVKVWGPIAGHLTRAQDEVRLLETSLDARMGPDLAPSLRNLRNAIVDCLDLARQYAPKAPEPAAPAADGAPGAEGEAAAAGPPAAVVSRADIYERLSEAAERLKQIEPHSPIPYLIQRAVELGQMPFPQLMKALITDAKVVDELNRGLGIKPDAPPPK